MITIIHGENIGESRKYYFDLKQKSKNPLTLAGATITITDLAQTLEGQNLFAEQKEIFIEEFFSKRKKGKETDSLLHYMQEHQRDHHVIFWESKALTPTQTKILSKSTLKKFDLPKTLFAFLDSIQPDNGKNAIQLFHKTIETEEPELVFFMITRLVRTLLALSDSSSSEPIDEIKRLAPWQKGKLEKQSLAFGQEKLLGIYSKLFTIEEGMKTGKMGTTLIQAIDFLLVKI